MEETPDGTPVGVDDPYAHAGACDHLTDDGRCRFALDRAVRGAGESRGPTGSDALDADPAFAAARRDEGYACVAGSDDRDWRDCPHYRSTTDGRECVRCGLPEIRMAHGDDRPLIEEHHLSYGGRGGGDPSHEITVALCRWCHAAVHRSVARIDDDASPSVEAMAAREDRRGRETEQFGFASAAERRDGDGGG